MGNIPMKNNGVAEVIRKISSLLKDGDSSPFNYERHILMDKAPYLDAFIDGEHFPPFEVEIQMSSNCNLECRWCIGPPRLYRGD